MLEMSNPIGHWYGIYALLGHPLGMRLIFLLIIRIALVS